MIRPKRLRIISFVAARASRKVEVKLTLMTSSQSSSRNCTNRLSRVMPALATRMSSCPMACSADGTSASTSAASDRLHGRTWTRSPNLAGERVQHLTPRPEIATVAPWACSAWAIALPMPPVAPVTSAFLPVRSNITFSPLRLSALRPSHLWRPPDRSGLRPRCRSLRRLIRLTSPLSTLPAPISKKRVTPWLAM